MNKKHYIIMAKKIMQLPENSEFNHIVKSMSNDEIVDLSMFVMLNTHDIIEDFNQFKIDTKINYTLWEFILLSWIFFKKNGFPEHLKTEGVIVIDAEMIEQFRDSPIDEFLKGIPKTKNNFNLN